jgi:hypothetical protein
MRLLVDSHAFTMDEPKSIEPMFALNPGTR